MRWVPIGLIGAGAMVAGWVSGPLFQDWTSPSDYGFGFWMPWGWIAILFYAPFFLALLGGTVLAFRALWLATRRADLAARIAMGSTRSSLVTGQVREGLRDGVIAGGGGIAVGALARQLVTGFSDVEFVSNTLWDYLAVVILVVVCFTLAYWIAAVWATRGSVRAVASGATAGARANPTAERPRRSRRRRLGWLIAVVLALLLAIALPSLMGADETTTGPMMIVAMAAGVVSLTVLYVVIPGVFIYGGAKAALPVSRLVARGLAWRAAPGSGRSLAADALGVRTHLRTGALAAIIAVMGVAGVGTAIYASNQARPNMASSVVPEATLASVRLMTGEEPLAGPSGWIDALDADTVAALHADPDLMVIDAGVLLTDRRDVADEPWEGEFVQDRDLLLAVDAGALASVNPDAARVLYLTDSVEWTYGILGTTGRFDSGDLFVEVNGVRENTADLSGVAPWAGIEREWAERVWGPAPTAALLIYPATDVPVADALQGHDLSGLALERPHSDPYWSPPMRPGVIAGATAPFLLVAVGIVIAMAAASQRLRARDQATLQALGATRGALRRVALIEASVPTLIAALGGALAGGALGAVMTEIGVAPLGTAPWSMVAANVRWTLGLVPWHVLIALALGGAVVAGIGAAMLRVRLDRLTPAQQLAEAQKAGIS